MGMMDRLFGRRDGPQPEQPSQRRNTIGSQPAGQLTDDEQAVARYRYMLQTAPPETIEQAHAEAFAKLTPEQRRLVLEQLSTTVPEQERTAGADDPQTLARMATRAELRQPGMLERTFGGIGGGGGGMGMGGLMAGSFLTSLAGSFVGSAIAQQFFNNSGFDQGFAEGGLGEEAGTTETGQDIGDEMPIDTGDEVGGIGDIGGDLFGGDDF